MADPKTFTLIGEFKDGITPELARINRQLASLNNSFKSFGGKGARNTARDVGRFSVAVNSLNENLKIQNQAMRAAIAPMREYRREVGKTVGALTRLTAASGDVRAIEATNRALLRQARLHAQLNTMRNRRSGTRTMAAPGGDGGGRGGRGGGGIGGGSFNMADFGFAYTLGNTLSQGIQSAVVTGFQIGVDLMMKPFQYFAGAFGERVQDELSDLKAAGGLFSISKRAKNPFLKDIDEAIQFQQDTNKAFAHMAADLPGVTNDYVQVGKRLSDTIARITNQDFAAARAEAMRIRSTQEGKKYYGGEIKGDMATQQQEVIKTLLGDITKKATIAGLGGTRTAGGISGAYGLPGIVERMMSEEQVSVAKFQRYASVFSDPTIADALRRNVDKVNKSTMNTTERYKALSQLLDEVVTPELIEKLRTSVDGIYQGYKAAFFDPDTGLFGLGRQFKGIGKKLNKYGQYVNKAGEVVKNMADAAPEDLSIFEIVRDIFANFGQALMPIVDILPTIFDPLKNVAQALMQVRHYAAEFNRTFNMYRQGFLELSKTPGMEFLKDTADIRATLLAITNFLRDFGVIDSAGFNDILGKLKTKDANFAQILTSLVDKLLNSELANRIGETIGSIIGTVLVDVAKVTGFLSGRIEKSSKLFEGLRKGFEDSGGMVAVQQIFEDIFKGMFNILRFIWDKLPWQAKMLAAFMVIAPAVIQFVAMQIATSLLAGIRGMGNNASTLIRTSFRKGGAASVVATGANVAALGQPVGRRGAAASAAFRPVGVAPRGFGHVALPGGSRAVGGVTGPYTAPGIPKRAAALARTSFGPLAQMRGKAASLLAPAIIAMATKAPAITKAAKSVMGAAKGIPGLGIAFGALDFGLRKAGGQSTAVAAGGAIGGGVGGVAGAALGSALGPAGTVAGGVLGAWIGDWLGTNIGKALDAAGPALQALPAKLSALWSGFTQWVTNLPQNLGYVIGFAVQALTNSLQRANNWFLSLPEKIGNWLSGVKSGVSNFIKSASTYLSSGSTWSSIATAIVNGLKSAISTLVNAPGAFANWVGQGLKNLGSGFRAGRSAAGAVEPVAPIYDWARGGLSDAIASEMRNKPRGSNLVVANSSETIIPAAGGYGMKNFLGQVKMAVASANRTSGGGTVTVNAPITIHQQAGQNPEELAAIVARELWNAVAETQRSTMFV